MSCGVSVPRPPALGAPALPPPPLTASSPPALLSRQAVEAAKKEAVARRVDVETFQALVSAAHLQPMRGGLRLAPAAGSGKPAVPRHFRADGTLAGSSGSSLPASTAACQATAGSSTTCDSALRTGALFVRAWRAAAPAGRAELLRRAVAAGALPRLLRLELSSLLLEELLDCLPNAAAAAGETAAAGAAAEVATCPSTAAAGADSPATAAAGAEPSNSELAQAVLQAAEAASSYPVAKAGLSLQARQRLAGLRAALQ